MGATCGASAFQADRRVFSRSTRRARPSMAIACHCSSRSGSAVLFGCRCCRRLESLRSGIPRQRRYTTAHYPHSVPHKCRPRSTRGRFKSIHHFHHNTHMYLLNSCFPCRPFWLLLYSCYYYLRCTFIIHNNIIHD